MKKYTSCFIGIALPEEYIKEYKSLINILKNRYPFLTENPRIPHITIFYLNSQSQENIPEIVNDLKLDLDLLRETELEVGGFGYFRDDDPKVLFLNIKYPKNLKDFNKSITRPLEKYYADDNRFPFHPHMTLARIKDKNSQKFFWEKRIELEDLLSKICWKFNIREIYIYGVDSTKSPEKLEKLKEILI